MKIILTLFLLLAKTIAVGQKGILYNDLRIDIFDKKISLLNIKEIEQSRNYTTTYKLASGKDTVNSYSNIQFVLKYDSLNRIHSVFYDFEKEYSSYNDRILNDPIFGQNPKPMNIILTNTKLYPSYNNNDTIYYNYYENNYIYNNQNNQLEYIKFSYPFRYIIDGVFIQEKKYNDICYKYTYKNKELIKEDMYSEGKLSWTTEYYYKTMLYKGQEIQLLEKIIEKSDNNIVIEYLLKYKL